MSLQKILIDTDVLIDFLRKKEAAQKVLEKASQSGDLYCSVITLAELLAGMRPVENEATEDLIAGFTLLSVNEPIAREAGILRNRYGSKRFLLPDCLIAATAVIEDCHLVTFNSKDFPFKEVRLFRALSQ